MGIRIDFFVVGAARSGTTSLYHYLKAHPGVYLPEVKELNYFSRVTSEVPQDYELPEPGVEYHMKVIRDESVYQGLYEGASEGQLKGDVSPSYLSNTETARRIAKHNKDARIILTLRNPADRAYSHYLMNLGVGYEPHGTFEEALQAKQKDVWSGGNRYTEWSRYYEPVKSYFDHFPASQIKLLLFEDWTAHKEESVAGIYRFLGLNEGHFPDFENHNKAPSYRHIKTLNRLRHPAIKSLVKRILPEGSTGRLRDMLFQSDQGAPELDPELRARLNDTFRPDVEKLASLTGLPLLTKWKME